MKTIALDGQQIYLTKPLDSLLKALEVGRSLTTHSERLCLISGLPGTGKSTGAKIFCAQHEDAIYLNPPPASVLRPGRLLSLLIEVLDVRIGPQSSLHHRLQSIIQSLRQRPRMLVFDEGDRLRSQDNLDLLRYVHDEAGARIAFVSIPRLEGALLRSAAVGTRLGIIYRVEFPSLEEVLEILPDLPGETAKEIFRLADGHMREVMVIARLLRAGVKKEQWTPNTVRRVARSFTLRAVA